MIRFVPFERHPNRDRLAVSPAAVAAVESALPSSAHSTGAARIILTTGKEYVVEGGLDETIRKLVGGRGHETAGHVESEIRVIRADKDVAEPARSLAP